MQDFGLIHLAQRDVRNPVGARLVVDEGVVDGEHDAVHAHLHDRAQQGRVGEVSAGGNPEVLGEVLPEGAWHCLVAHSFQGIVDAPQQERQALPHVAKDEFQAGVFVEHAGQHNANALIQDQVDQYWRRSSRELCHNRRCCTQWQ